MYQQHTPSDFCLEIYFPLNYKLFSVLFDKGFWTAHILRSISPSPSINDQWYWGGFLYSFQIARDVLLHPKLCGKYFRWDRRLYVTKVPCPGTQRASRNGLVSNLEPWAPESNALTARPRSPLSLLLGCYTACLTLSL